MNKILLKIKQNGELVPADELSNELVKKYKPGTIVSVKVTSGSARSVEHHRKFFALLSVTMEHWNPGDRMVSTAEQNVLRSFCQWIHSQAGTTQEQNAAILQACATFLEEINTKRKGGGIGEPEASIESLLEWVKMGVNHAKLIRCPDGIRKIPRSISFSKMSQEDFDEFYKSAVNLCWRYVLSSVMHDQRELDDAVNKLLNF